MLEKLPTDKLSKFLTVLSVLGLVTLFVITEQKRDALFEETAVIFKKQDTLTNLLHNETLERTALRKIRNRKFINDSIEWKRVMNGEDREVAFKWLNSSIALLKETDTERDSLDRAEALFDGTIAAKTSELRTQRQLRDMNREAFKYWNVIYIFLNILLVSIGIYGISRWMREDKHS